MNENNEIIVRIENFIVGGDGAQSGIPTMDSSGAVGLPSQQGRRGGSGFIGGISAHLLISGASRMLAATGNQELANGIRETAEWTFLGGRAFAGDPTAIATAAFKLSALAISKITDYINEQKEIAQSYNELDLLKMRAGIITVKSNTEISYGKYNRLKLTDRK